jgi:hypothetical protein
MSNRRPKRTYTAEQLAEIAQTKETDKAAFHAGDMSAPFYDRPFMAGMKNAAIDNPTSITI